MKISQFVLLCVLSFAAGYALWVFFSFHIIPVSQGLQGGHIPKWQTDLDCYKMRPGDYHYKTHGVDYHVNTHGFRGPEIHKKNPGVTRIVAMGASSTLGLESSEGKTWPSQLQKYLLDQGYAVEVINTGISGANSQFHLHFLKNDILPEFQPDLILYYEGYNEIAEPLLERYDGERSYGEFIKLWLRGKIFQLQFLCEKHMNWRMDFISVMRSVLGKPESNYKQNLAQMYAMTQKTGVKLIQIKQQLNYPSELKTLLADGVSQRRVLIKKIRLNMPFWLIYYKNLDIYELQSELAQTNQISVIDLEKAFLAAQQNKETLFLDTVHLTEKGNSLIAREVGKYLIRSKILQKLDRDNSS